MDEDAAFWAHRGKKQTIKPNGLFQHFQNRFKRRVTDSLKRSNGDPLEHLILIPQSLQKDGSGWSATQFPENQCHA